MAWPKEKKEDTHQILLESASILFMQHGYEAVSIDAIMAQAKLTHGGFYNHFASKSELYHAAILSTLQQGKMFFAKINDGQLSDFIKYYLSDSHCRSPTICPLSSITPDITRHSEDIRMAYEHSFNEFVKGIRYKSYNQETQTKISEQQALQIAITLIGGLTQARATSNQHLANAILLACQANTLAILEK